MVMLGQVAPARSPLATGSDPLKIRQIMHNYILAGTPPAGRRSGQVPDRFQVPLFSLIIRHLAQVDNTDNY
jgi:hypothetical protein